LVNGETSAAEATSIDITQAIEVEGKKILDNIAGALQKGFEDLSALVVVTAVVETSAQIAFGLKDVKFDDQTISTKITAMALTKLELDGDVYHLIPPKTIEAEIRAEVIKEHKENLALSKENWKNFIDGIATIVQIGADMANHPLPNLRSRSMQVYTQPSLTR
jgi:hypothetical protein